ncbi:MAG: NADPH-dependent 7-cyano-7-deazaguanine reductase QueF [Nitrospinae bacterium]|nr:NADPH-dependent 7-cyano-7-deazaguanine reductase QueF [Nitrospinota bacterium]
MARKPNFKQLGRRTKIKYDAPSKKTLEFFPNPMRGDCEIEINAPEFTALCPMTGQPDFAAIVIKYVPDKLCLESKSLKLYLGAYRMHGIFHEACVQKISDDLLAVLKPKKLFVEGQFAPRGGIKFWPRINYAKKS